MTKHLQYLFVFVTFLLSSPISAQSGELLIPASAEMTKYPLHSAKSMSVREMAKLGLHPMVLKEPWVGLNYYRNVSRFTLDTLPVGDLVLADSAGTPWYKVSCVNRLITLTKCPDCLMLLSKSTGGGSKKGSRDSFPALFTPLAVTDSVLLSREPGFWSDVARNFGNIMDATKSAASWILPLLLWLLILALLVLGALSLIRWIRGSGRSGGATRPTPAPALVAPAPAVPVTPVAPQQAPIVPAPVVPVSQPVAAAQPVTQVSVVTETPVASGKTFVHFAPADGQGQQKSVLRFSANVRDITHEREGDVTTIRFRA